MATHVLFLCNSCNFYLHSFYKRRNVSCRKFNLQNQYSRSIFETKQKALFFPRFFTFSSFFFLSAEKPNRRSALRRTFWVSLRSADRHCFVIFKHRVHALSRVADGCYCAWISRLASFFFFYLPPSCVNQLRVPRGHLGIFILIMILMHERQTWIYLTVLCIF